MEKKHFMGMLAAGAAALLLSTIPAGCTDERAESPSTGGRIGFAVDLWKEGSAAQAALTKGTGATADGLPSDTLPAVSVIALEGDTSGDGKPLYLHAVTTDGIGDEATAQDGGEAMTKAAPVTTATMYDDMSVTAFVYPASDSWPSAFTGGSATSYMRTVRVKKSESWGTSYYWPGAARRISFFAVAPYDSPGLTRLTDGSGSTLPYLSYTVPTGVADQKDLLVAASTDKPGNTNAAEALTMKHALTAVRFVTGDDMLAGTVSKITLKGVYSTGRLPLQASAAWYDLGGARDFAQTFSPEAVAPDPQAPDTPLTPETATFMMLPQTLPTNAKIEVVYKDKLTNTQRTLTANIAGKAWPMGKTVTYRISTSSIVVTPTLAVTGPANEFLYTGGTQNYTVTSSVVVTRPGDPTQTLPMPWTTEFSEDGGISWSNTKPAWLTTFTESGAGSTSATPCTATVAAQTNTTANLHTEALRNATQVTNYDLSTHDYQGGTVAMRTANCYIVNAPGTYRLPLVYGNAVKGGIANTSAYTSQAPVAGDILKTFIDHLGAGIDNPYIYYKYENNNNVNYKPANCTLVWQDEPNLVTDVNLSSDGHFLEFTVGQSTIRQGNAVVAVRNASNTVLWSWHIWVTDYKPGATGTTPDKEITNYQNHKYKIMSFNLGWCDGKEETYAERTVQVRFKQKPTAGYTPAATQTITVKQKAHTITELGNNTYFQWGRKDPFVGGILDGSTTKNKTWYDASGTTHTNQLPPTGSFSTGNACITSYITNPNTFCTQYYMDSKYANLWSADNTVYTANDNSVVKTIYDPCPAGYKMPPGNAFTGFTTTGQNTISSSQFNVQQPWNNGWNFYCDPSKTQTVFFPASGYRDGSSAGLYPMGFNAYYWTAGPYGTSYGRSLGFYSGVVSPQNNDLRRYGFGVRAAQEE